MRGRNPMYLFMLAALCGSAMSCRRDTRADDEAAIRAATRDEANPLRQRSWGHDPMS
jgi:hypothetical protein